MTAESKTLHDIYIKAETALGAYIMACSTFEATCHIALRILLDINEEIERLLVGEPRISDLTDLVKQAAKKTAVAEDRREFLAELCTVGTQNNKIRQIVAHKPCNVLDDGTMTFSNEFTAKSQASKYVYKCLPQELRNQARLMEEAAFSMHQIFSEPELQPYFVQLRRGELASRQKLPLPEIPRPPLQSKLPK